MTQFGKFLVHYRSYDGLTQKKLGKLMGIQPTKVCDYEKGRRTPSFTNTVKYAKKLGIAQTTLLEIVATDKVKKINPRYRVELWRA